MKIRYTNLNDVSGIVAEVDKKVVGEIVGATEPFC